jgi:hypothetical protein
MGHNSPLWASKVHLEHVDFVFEIYECQIIPQLISERERPRCAGVEGSDRHRWLHRMKGEVIKRRSFQIEFFILLFYDRVDLRGRMVKVYRKSIRGETFNLGT